MSPLRIVLGLAVGVAGLIGMVRLVGAAETGWASYVWLFVLLPMLAWTAYAGWRARRARLAGRSLLLVAAMAVVGLVLAWFGTLGPVLALACSLAGFAVIWTHDLRARPRTESRFVSVDELRDES